MLVGVGNSLMAAVNLSAGRTSVGVTVNPANSTSSSAMLLNITLISMHTYCLGLCPLWHRHSWHHSWHHSWLYKFQFLFWLIAVHRIMHKFWMVVSLIIRNTTNEQSGLYSEHVLNYDLVLFYLNIGISLHLSLHPSSLEQRSLCKISLNILISHIFNTPFHTPCKNLIFFGPSLLVYISLVLLLPS